VKEMSLNCLEWKVEAVIGDENEGDGDCDEVICAG